MEGVILSCVIKLASIAIIESEIVVAKAPVCLSQAIRSCFLLPNVYLGDAR